jgi:hypothetical protein
MSTPRPNSAWSDAQNASLALRPRLELRVAKQAASVVGDVKRPNIQENQTETVIAQGLVEEIAIPAHKGRASQGSKPGNDVVILHSLASDITTDLHKGNAPLPEPRSLTLEHILVQDNHGETDLSRYSSA